MKKSMKLILLTPDNEFFSGDIISLNCETSDGRRGILPNHCSMIAELVPSSIKFKDLENKQYEVLISDGVLKVDKNKILILCGSANWIKK